MTKRVKKDVQTYISSEANDKLNEMLSYLKLRKGTKIHKKDVLSHFVNKFYNKYKKSINRKLKN
mgnify:CR=1 FL=1|tara:strand:- start:266 stop:457 length:192 start_codon:yes stop_codon:yes gene_type:complete